MPSFWLTWAPILHLRQVMAGSSKACCKRWIHS
jgi:hypothetical protein